MNKTSFIATAAISTVILTGTVFHYAKPWLPNMLGYSELGWVHTGHASMLADTTSYRKWTGWTGFKSRMPWPIDHYLLKLKAGQKVEMTLSGVVKHGSVRVGVMKRSGYYVNPIKTGQFTESQHLRLKDGSERYQTLVYEIKEDGYYNIIISTVGKLNKNYTVKSDMLYDVRWRLI